MLEGCGQGFDPHTSKVMGLLKVPWGPSCPLPLLEGPGCCLVGTLILEHCFACPKMLENHFEANPFVL